MFYFKKIELKCKRFIELTGNKFSSTFKTCLGLIGKSQMEK